MKVMVKAAQGQVIINEKPCRWQRTVASQIDKVNVLNAAQDLQLPLKDLIDSFAVPINLFNSKCIVIVHDHLVDSAKASRTNHIIFIKQLQLLYDFLGRIWEVSMEGDKLGA